jgi:hypothetical protein
LGWRKQIRNRFDVIDNLRLWTTANTGSAFRRPTYTPQSCLVVRHLCVWTMGVSARKPKRQIRWPMHRRRPRPWDGWCASARRAQRQRRRRSTEHRRSTPSPSATACGRPTCSICRNGGARRSMALPLAARSQISTSWLNAKAKFPHPSETRDSARNALIDKLYQGR